MSSLLKPIATMPSARLAAATILLCDMDDTMTTDGRLPASTLVALESLVSRGIRVVPVTGRSAGWCDHIARMWPVHAVIGETGAFYFSTNSANGSRAEYFERDADQRAEDRRRLDVLGEHVMAEVAGTALASDQAYRLCDLAIDLGEDVPALSESAKSKAMALLRDEGATVMASACHINAWFGNYNKLTMARRCLLDCFGMDINADNERVVFIGDSRNDEVMFGHFENATGVANVHSLELDTPPPWVTSERSAAGFSELVEFWLDCLDEVKA